MEDGLIIRFECNDYEAVNWTEVVNDEAKLLDFARFEIITVVSIQIQITSCRNVKLPTCQRSVLSRFVSVLSSTLFPFTCPPLIRA